MTGARSGPGRRRRSRLASLGRRCAGHGRPIVGAWLLVLVAVSVAGSMAGGGRYADRVDLPGTDAQQGQDLLRRSGATGSGSTGTVVFHFRTALGPGDRSVVKAAVDRLRRTGHVLSVSDPLAPADPASPGSRPTAGRTLPAVSADRTTAYASISTDAPANKLGRGFVTTLETALAPARRAGAQVELGGALGHLARPPVSDLLPELIGLVATVVILLIGFGSLIGAVIPILTAAITTAISLGLLGLVDRFVEFPEAAPRLATMIGLGVGIDYTLLLLTRYRRQLLAGEGLPDGIGRAVASAGRAVLVAGATVVIAISGLFAADIDLLRKLAIAIAIAVVVAVLGALTLTPAVLGLVGPRLDRWSIRRGRGRAVPAETARGPARGYPMLVTGRPWVFFVAGLALAAALAAPVAGLRLGHLGNDVDPRSYTDRRASDLVAAAFGPGANGPLTVVVTTGPEVPRDVVPVLARNLTTAVRATPGVAVATALQPTRDTRLLVGTVIAGSAPQDPATVAVLRDLQGPVLAAAIAGTPGASAARAYLTGPTAAQVALKDALSKRLPLVVGSTVLIAFAVLLLAFRGLLVALKAAALNLLSVGAACGVLVMVFQWHWGDRWLGVPGGGQIESYVPTLIFAITFGLSMDYEVFLLSQVREIWLQTGDNRRAVAEGLAGTGRVITSGALIMVSVFLAFLISATPVVTMLAVGLAASVLFDATVIRFVLVPAAMTLAGRANWWAPHRRRRALRPGPPARTPSLAGPAPSTILTSPIDSRSPTS